MAEAAENLTALQKVAAQTAPVSRFNTELVRSAWSAVCRRRREARRAARAARLGDYEDGPVTEDPLAYAYIEQLWTDHIVVQTGDGQGEYMRIPYTVESPGTTADNVKFGKPEKVRVAYVAATAQRGSEALELIALRNVAPSERDSLKDKGHTLPGTTSYPIKTLSDLNNAIQAYGRAKPEDRSRLKSHLLREAKRLGASQSVIDRIKALGSSDSVKATADSDEGAVALARVRTQAGARRYRKPIGAPIGEGGPGGDALATVAKAGSREGAGVTDDKLRGAIRSVAKEKTYRGGDVFGDIGNEGKLKSALTQIERLPDAKRGAAAAEVVKAAQALGLTSLVPASVKRLYREYIAQGSIKTPAKAAKKGS